MTTQFLGKAGEYAVASQLLLRGLSVHFPAVDVEGVDLIVGNRVRVQVKSARTRIDRKGYAFTMASRIPRLKSGVYEDRSKDWSLVVDFVICWGADENRFWVIPSAVFGAHRKVQTLLLGAPQTHWIVDQEEIRALASTGLNQREIACRMGISEMSVSRAVRGIEPSTSPSPSVEANRFEGAWREIISAVGMLVETNAPSHDTLQRSYK